MTTRPIAELPSALDHEDEIADRLRGHETAIFLDYDGTLTPIVADPTDATIGDDVRDVLRRLAEVTTLAIVSGRDLDDVRRMVGVEGIHYAGSHGFDILAPDGTNTQHGTEFLPALDAAEDELRDTLAATPGARVERKGFAIAVHLRQVDDAREEEVEAAVDDATSDDLRVTGGKQILELRPDLDWDKGRALLSLLATLGLDRPDVVPIYIGDDVTDEDALRAIADRGIGLVVRGEDDERPTSAHYAIAEPREVVELLAGLADRLSQPTPPG